jgi:glycopeptide antibiotics resistance protein
MKVLQFIMKKNTYTLLMYLSFGLVALLVLYLSWVSSPVIGNMAFMPSWVSTWVDSFRFNAIRTAIPLIPLGIIAGLYLYLEKRTVLCWYAAWAGISLLVLLAEVGQYFRPMRSFDVRDIFWGSFGAALGLQIVFFIKELRSYFKRKRNR